MHFVRANRFASTDPSIAAGMPEGVEFLLTDKEREALRALPCYGGKPDEFLVDSEVPADRLWRGSDNAPRGSRVGFYYPGGIGDAVAHTAILASLKAQRSDLKLRVVSIPSTAAVWMNNPDIDAVRGVPFTRGMFDAIADQWILGDSTLYRLRDQKQPNMYEVFEDQFCVTIPRKVPNLVVTKDELVSVARVLPKVQKDRPVVVFAPLASKVTRTWPAGKWRPFVDRLQKAGYMVVAVGDGPEGLELARRLDGVLDPRQVFAGTLSLRQLIALVFIAELVVTVDTSLAHIAGAFETKCISLFGPFDPAWRVSTYRNHESCWRPDFCEKAPCAWHDAGFPAGCPGECNDQCDVLGKIEVDDVLADVRDVVAPEEFEPSRIIRP